MTALYHCLPPGGRSDVIYSLMYIPTFIQKSRVLIFNVKRTLNSRSLFQDNSNIDAAIMCLVKSIMSLDEEMDAAAAAKRQSDNSFLVLPRFDRGAKERGPGGCSGCSSLRPRH